MCGRVKSVEKAKPAFGVLALDRGKIGDGASKRVQVTPETFKLRFAPAIVVIGDSPDAKRPRTESPKLLWNPEHPQIVGMRPKCKTITDHVEARVRQRGDRMAVKRVSG